VLFFFWPRSRPTSAVRDGPVHPGQGYVTGLADAARQAAGAIAAEAGPDSEPPMPETVHNKIYTPNCTNILPRERTFVHLDGSADTARLGMPQRADSCRQLVVCASAQVRFTFGAEARPNTQKLAKN